ncbi:putative Ig domain-containing protein [Streptomyces sp. NRRL S-1813]|uniref:putative Ig domain-containing protein n=1 Tax=Streptomyces sp. NRRL S-1813 TaxID=1463888 RepID=UPI0004C5FB58|nr:putative Ig domain-containing protein [Streptomyces sp. NRRL S-1813]
MHIRHIALYALAAGALVVPVMLFGEGEGADAATGTGTESAADTAQAVVVQPDPVAPGAGFSVSDGGSCQGDTAEATFDDADIPAMQLSAQSGEISGTAIVPEGTAPGSYQVTLTCGGTSGARQSALDPGRAGDEERGGARGKADGYGHGRAEERGEESGDGRKTLTGTMIVSGGADEAVPQGGADTGAGGAAGTGGTATTLTGVLLLAAAGWGALRRRRPRDTRS